MELEKIEKLEKSIENLKNKSSRIYFLVQDTKGNPRAGVRYIYDFALSLKKNGFNPIIIHETKEYKGVGEWLGEEYMESLPHQTIEGENLAISPEDFIVIPELYGHVMEQLKAFTCGKIVLCQSYDYMLETLAPGVTWQNYGFLKCITTSEEQKKYLSGIMKSVSYDVVNPLIPSVFKKKEKPSKPIISIHTREQRDTAKIIKSFYLKYPQYRWLTFRDMRGIKQEDFAKFLQESFVSVWVDYESGFGTFPIESMISNTPVIGKAPALKPEWISDENGIWTYEFNEIVDILANFIQNWLEDNISDQLYENMQKTAEKYTSQVAFDESVLNVFNEYFEVRGKMFEEQLEKIKITEEK
jgi:glycosyltransferase involved in cell wall biosynthesis